MWELDSERNGSSLQEHMPRVEETGYRKSRNVDVSSTVRNELAGGAEES
jgi:CRISPR/Cas system type I-B associated protein Csh2 (Cas7 group RAMP superfamily)